MKISNVLALCIFSTSFAFGQVGIGVALPEKELDVKGEIRFRDLEPIQDSPNVAEYNRQLVLDKEGDLATVPMYSEPNGYRLRNVYYKNMEKAVKTDLLLTSDIDLNLFIEVSVPPKTESLVLVDYSVPVMMMTAIIAEDDVKDYGYLGITFKKETVGVAKSIRELDQASRKNTLAAHYHMPVAGFAVSGKAVDVLINSTDKTIKYRYIAHGYVEENKTRRVVIFGMYSAGAKNYNWGKGAMTLQVFDRNLVKK